MTFRPMPYPIDGLRVLAAIATHETGAPLADLARQRGVHVEHVSLGEPALARLAETPFDVLLVETDDVDDFLREYGARAAAGAFSAQLVCIVSPGALDGRETIPAVPCDVLERPFTAAALGTLLRAAARRARLQGENRRLQVRLEEHLRRELVGRSPEMDTLRHEVRLAAAGEDAVVVRGAHGSGITTVARSIHDHSSRAHRPFVRLDCSVHGADSLHRELFGSLDDLIAASSETGGRLDQADRGTLFLDDVDGMALAVQRKLARVLEDRQRVHPGGAGALSGDVRILAGTHQDLAELVRRGTFHEGLYRQLASRTIEVPALRDRRADIGLLVEHLLQKLALEEGKPVKKLTVEALALLEAHDWPGNVAELRNVIDRAHGLGHDSELTAEAISPWIAAEVSGELPAGHPGMTLREMERKLIETTFARFAGNREKTAQALQIGLRTLSGKLREYGYPPRGGPGSNQPRQRRAA